MGVTVHDPRPIQTALQPDNTKTGSNLSRRFMQSDSIESTIFPAVPQFA